MGNSIVLKVVSDTKGAVAGLKQLNRAVGGQMSKTDKVLSGIRKAAIPATAALAGLGVGAKKAVDAAADMNEALSKNEVLFTTQAKDVAKWSKGMAKGFGISRKAALDAAGTFATFGKSAGLQGANLSAFSTDLTELASDLASFNNTSPEEAIEALGSALRGEAEPMRKYGVLLDDASLRQEALAQGLIKTTKQALTPQQKVLAAQKLILKQTADAQGDYARTSDSAANRQKALRAQLENVTAELGNALLPAFTMLVGWMQKAATWASQNTTTVKVLIATFGGLAAAIVAANVALKAYTVAAKAAKAAQVALNAAMRLNPIGIVVTALAALVAGIVIAYKKSETFRGIVQKVWDWIKKLANVIKTVAKGAFAALKTYIDIATAPMRALIAAMEKIISLARKVKSAIQGTGRVPDVLRPRNTATLTPTSRSTTVNVSLDAPTQTLISEEQVTRALVRLLQRSDARNGLAFSL